MFGVARSLGERQAAAARRVAWPISIVRAAISKLAGRLGRSGGLRAGVRARPALPGLELQLSDRYRQRRGCWLKSSVPPGSRMIAAFGRARRRRGGTQRSAIETSIDRSGGDYHNFELKSGEGDEACKAACADDNKCRAWTYARPGYVGKEAHCFLKKEDQAAAAQGRIHLGRGAVTFTASVVFEDARRRRLRSSERLSGRGINQEVHDGFDAQISSGGADRSGAGRCRALSRHAPLRGSVLGSGVQGGAGIRQPDPASDIHADGARPARPSIPFLDKLTAEPKFKNLKVFRVDFDAMKPVVWSLGAQMQSTLIVFKGAAEQGRSVGDTEASSIAALLDKSL